MLSAFSLRKETNMLSEYLLIGEVLKPQGIKGLVKVRPDTDDPERFLDLEYVFVKKGDTYEKAKVDDVSIREDAVFLRLNNVQDRDMAEKQRGTMLYIDRENAVELTENETFICDLIGCEVKDRQGNVLGKIKDVLQPGGNDVYVVKCKQGEMLLPALLHIVTDVQTENGFVTVDESRLHEVAVCDWE